MSSTTSIQQWTEALGNKGDDCKIKALTEAMGAVARGIDLRQLVPSVAKVAKAANPELVSLAYLFLTYVGRKDPQALLLAVNALELGATQGSTPMIREQAIRTLGEICTPAIIEDVSEFIKKAARDENAYVRSTVAICISNIFKLDPQKANKVGLVDILEVLLDDKSIDVAIIAARCLLDVDKGRLSFDRCTDLLHKVSDASPWNVLVLLDVIEGWSITEVDVAKTVIEHLFLLVQHADSSIVISSMRIILKATEALPDKKLREGMVSKLILILITLTLSNTFELRYVILSSLPVLIQHYPDLFNAHVLYFIPCYTDDKMIRLCKLDVLYYLANNTNAKDIIVGLGNWVLDETSPDIIWRCIETFGRIAIKLHLFAERILNLLKSILLALLDNSIGKHSNTLIDSFDGELFNAIHNDLATRRITRDGLTDLHGLTISPPVQVVMEEIVIQMSILLVSYPVSVTDVLPFFEPILYLVRTERGVEASLSIFHYYQVNRLNMKEMFITSLAESNNLDRYSPVLRLMLLHLLIQRYFCLLKDSIKENEESESNDVMHDTVSILTNVFAKLMVRESEPIVQLQVGFYYNIFIALRQGSQADTRVSSLSETLSSIEPLLHHSVSTLFNGNESNNIHDPTSFALSPADSLNARQPMNKRFCDIGVHSIATCSTVLTFIEGLNKD